ncbi:hypothetical protein [Shewanella algicola]|uniref:hypothetical protein n=1 Tax=Shewanella algicola TaxID=640633 RepID=UPI0016684D71|nr:hypothetical protein [Shewanella algicola]
MKLNQCLTLCCFVGLAIPSLVHAEQQNHLRYEVLKNVSYGKCAYSEEVTMEVFYSIPGDQSRQIVMSLKNKKGGSLPPLLRDVEPGKGSFLWNFDAGKCISDLQLSIN